MLGCQGSWTLIARDRAQRDAWITALAYATGQTGLTATFDEADMFSDSGSATSAGNVSVCRFRFLCFRSGIFTAPLSVPLQPSSIVDRLGQSRTMGRSSAEICSIVQ